MEMEVRARCGSTLMKAHTLIDREELRARIVERYRRELSHDNGQKALHLLVVFKAVLLGQWPNLSTAKLEKAMHLRVAFGNFCGRDLPGNVPDETTLCRFRNRLITSASSPDCSLVKERCSLRVS
jgi:IS5 family transposase